MVSSRLTVSAWLCPSSIPACYILCPLHYFIIMAADMYSCIKCQMCKIQKRITFNVEFAIKFIEKVFRCILMKPTEESCTKRHLFWIVKKSYLFAFVRKGLNVGTTCKLNFKSVKFRILYNLPSVRHIKLCRICRYGKNVM